MPAKTTTVINGSMSPKRIPIKTKIEPRKAIIGMIGRKELRNHRSSAVKSEAVD